MICTFFGHKLCPDSIEDELERQIRYLIAEKGVTEFLCGNQGGFDSMVRRLLKAMKAEYGISYSVVLAYMPQKTKRDSPDDYSDTVFPECLAGVHPKYAISKRNMWMIEKADFVITYVHNTTGGASRFKSISEKKGKTVINI